jgi:DNA-binding SARP family transcriptional activator
MLGAGDEAAGLDALRRALAIGRGRGYLAFPLWHREMMAALCARALEAGIETDYVRALVRRHQLLPDPPPSGADGWPWAVTVRALGGFDLEVDGAPVRFARKVQQKPLRLLQAIVAHGGLDVPGERVADALWPEVSGDAAAQALATTLHRLRALLGDEQAVRLHGHVLSLDPRRVWTDVWAFDRLLAEADDAAARGRTPAGIALTERALALYRGPFLGARDVDAWALSLRERLRARFLRATGRLGRWVSAADPERGLACYERGLEVDDLAEDLYQGLMICHLRLGRPSDGLAAYERCRRMLAAGLGVAPSAATEALRRAFTAPGRGAPALS